MRHIGVLHWGLPAGSNPDVEKFLASGRAQPLPSWGPCQAATCLRTAGTPARLCHVHDARWLQHRKQHPDTVFDHWCATAAAAPSTGQINLRSLPERVRLQLLVALQRRVKAGTKIHLRHTDRIAQFLRQGRHPCLLEAPDPPSAQMQDALHAFQPK